MPKRRQNLNSNYQNHLESNRYEIGAFCVMIRYCFQMNLNGCMPSNEFMSCTQTAQNILDNNVKCLLLHWLLQLSTLQALVNKKYLNDYNKNI